VRQASALACEGSVCHPKIRKKKEKEDLYVFSDILSTTNFKKNNADEMKRYVSRNADVIYKP